VQKEQHEGQKTLQAACFSACLLAVVCRADLQIWMILSIILDAPLFHVRLHQVIICDTKVVEESSGGKLYFQEQRQIVIMLNVHTFL